MRCVLCSTEHYHEHDREVLGLASGQLPISQFVQDGYRPFRGTVCTYHFSRLNGARLLVRLNASVGPHLTLKRAKESAIALYSRHIQVCLLDLARLHPDMLALNVSVWSVDRQYYIAVLKHEADRLEAKGARLITRYDTGNRRWSRRKDAINSRNKRHG